mmetsp:Transcript_31911/g.58455  ORF Transcript_31911/g.58455 Transcript_31911/m.58455 type:complete len:234 (+) Transcript_31911:303-1004(+)
MRLRRLWHMRRHLLLSKQVGRGSSCRAGGLRPADVRLWGTRGPWVAPFRWLSSLLEFVLGMSPATNFLDESHLCHQSTKIWVAESPEMQLVVRVHLLEDSQEAIDRDLVILNVLEKLPDFLQNPWRHGLGLGKHQLELASVQALLLRFLNASVQSLHDLLCASRELFGVAHFHLHLISSASQLNPGHLGKEFSHATVAVLLVVDPTASRPHPVKVVHIAEIKRVMLHKVLIEA